jgi:O-antigen/teichoic acid export membrane protein
MPISIISIARNSIKLTSVKAITAVGGLAVTLYAATILTPTEYGTYGLLALWLTYVTFVAPGIYSAASREIPVLLGKKQEKDALKVQNISVSAELLYTIAPAAVIVGASFFYADTLLRTGLLIIAMSYVTNRVTSLWSNMNFNRQKFNTVALGSLIISIVSPAVTLATLHWLKVYALIVGPLAAHAAAIVYYFTKGAIGFRFTLDKREIIRLAKIGIVLQGLGIMFWAFRMADRTIIAAALPLAQLGLYTFAIGFLTYALTFFNDFGRVLQPTLWKEAGTAETVRKGFRDTRRIAIYIALGTAIAIPLAQLIFNLVVNLITRKYVDSLPIFNVLSYNLYLMALAIVPGLILNSSLVNKQRLPLIFYSIGLALNIGFDLLVIRLGYGVIGVAWVTIVTQGLVTLILYYLIKNYIYETTGEFIKFGAVIIIPFIGCLPFYFLHGYLDTAVASRWALAGISLGAQAAVWTLIIGVFYRGYVSARELRVIIREIRTTLSKSQPDDTSARD